MAPTCLVLLISLVGSAAHGAVPGRLPTPETRTLEADEAEGVLERDWLFQAGDAPTLWRIQMEVGWTRDLAARIAARPSAPDLAGPLAQLAALEPKLSTPETTRAPPPKLPPGLIARWGFDEESDAGAVGLAQPVPGVFGRAMAFTGGGYVPTGVPVPTGPYTVACWLSTTGGVMDVLGSGISPGDALIVVNNGPVRVHQWTDGGGCILDGRTAVTDGRWHHVAQVVGLESLSLYIDGKLDVMAPLQGRRVAAASPLNLGARDAASGQYRFRGCLDEVCLFDRALSEGELADLYEAGRPSVETSAGVDRDLYLAVRRVKRRIMLSDPVIDFSKVLFVDVPAVDALNHQSMHRVWPQAQQDCGRLLVLEGLGPGGRLRKLAGPRPGMFWRPDLSYDGKRVLFCYRPKGDRTFHLYETGLNGKGLRQLTYGSYDDLDPIYAPDGRILFLTDRGNSYARCAVGHPSYVLARCEPDGKGIYILSASNEPEYTPAMLPDGRVLYTRWEYTDKELMRIQSLWTANPDGTAVNTFWGNQSYRPDMLIEARPMPDGHRVMFSGQGHHDVIHGSLGILDLRECETLNYPDGLTKVTPDLPWAEVGDGPHERPESDGYHASGDFEGYRCPYPLSDDLFLVCARPRGGRFQLYLMDIDGNRELLYEGAYDILYPMPIRPRKRPPGLPDRVAWPGLESEGRRVEPGVLYSANVFEGMPNEVREVAKYVRVINQDYTTFTLGLKTQGPEAWDGVPHMHAGPPVSITGNDGIKRILGTVPIEPDGSVRMQVPPAKQLHFQLLDEHYRAVQTMRSFTNVMPGESRGCVGCHEMHSRAPAEYTAQALQKPAVVPTPPPWGPEYNLSYRGDIQPVLDKHCGSCHRNGGVAQDKLDLTLRPSTDAGAFPEPYVTLTLGKERSFPGHFPANCSGGIAGTILPMAYPNPPEDDCTYPPMTTLSYRSELVDRAMRLGSMDSLSLRKLIAWVDLLCPYLGEAEIRSIPDPDPSDPYFANSPYPPRTPGIRPFADSPYPPRMANAPTVNRAYCQDEFPTQAHRLRTTSFRTASRSRPPPP